ATTAAVASTAIATESDGVVNLMGSSGDVGDRFSCGVTERETPYRPAEAAATVDHRGLGFAVCVPSGHRRACTGGGPAGVDVSCRPGRRRRASNTAAPINTNSAARIAPAVT